MSGRELAWAGHGGFQRFLAPARRFCPRLTMLLLKTAPVAGIEGCTKNIPKAAAKWVKKYMIWELFYPFFAVLPPVRLEKTITILNILILLVILSLPSFPFRWH
ncbi:MAG: hypothetical protein JRJ56_07600 [Deltaproteobacteria bacterium]|nr:hypothetical protein [Deltaproteobacteria bacterium]